MSDSPIHETPKSVYLVKGQNKNLALSAPAKLPTSHPRISWTVPGAVCGWLFFCTTCGARLLLPVASNQRRLGKIARGLGQIKTQPSDDNVAMWIEMTQALLGGAPGRPPVRLSWAGYPQRCATRPLSRRHSAHNLNFVPQVAAPHYEFCAARHPKQ